MLERWIRNGRLWCSDRDAGHYRHHLPFLQGADVEQVAAVAALNGPQDCVREVRELYRQRRDVLIQGLAAAGWDVPSPPASMFAWAPIPPRYRELGSLGFSKLLLRKAGVAVSPGIGFGEYGDGHVRLALVENVQRIRQATRNVKAFLQAEDALPEPPTQKNSSMAGAS